MHSNSENLFQTVGIKEKKLIANFWTMQDYDSNIPYIVLDKRGNILKKIVKVSMTIKEIQNIAEVQSRFTTFNLK